MRLDRLLSNLKYGSRTEIQKIIKRKRVTVNDKVTIDGRRKVDPNKDKIIIDDETIYYKDSVLIMLNKPSGYVSAIKDAKDKTVLDLIKEPYSRFDLSIAGRLDKDTEGLILLTNSGKLLREIITPSKDVYKKYFVKVEKPFKDPNVLDGDYQILDGKNYLFKPLKPFIEKLNDNEFYLSIKEGKFHQVKKMVEHFNNKVIYLKRVKIGKIELDETLKLGEYKELFDYKI